MFLNNTTLHKFSGSLLKKALNNSLTKLQFKSFSTPKKTYTTEEMNHSCKEYTMFSWSAQAKIAPIAMSKAEGCFFWDVSGKKYFDMNSQLMCSNIGHGKVIQAIKVQAEKLAFAGPTFSTRVKAEKGPKLAQQMPAI